MAAQLEGAGQDDYIPCLYYQGRNDKVMIHFHANGEDIGLTSPLMNKIVERIGVSIICVEYPGYGVYRGAGDQRAMQILEDAKSVYMFIRDVCKVPENRIIICGRSIGSGPACHLASTFDALALMLISPIKSVVDVARQKYGRIVDFLIEERFDNIGCARRIKCPTVIFHGIADSMVPHQSSIEMLLHGFCNCEASLFLREDMEHNKFNYVADIIDPLRYFFKINGISTKNKVSRMSTEAVESLRRRGYADVGDLCLLQRGKQTSKSQYYNNFDQRFMVAAPLKTPQGSYIENDFTREITEDQRVAIANEVMSGGESSDLDGEDLPDPRMQVMPPLDLARPSLFAKDTANYLTQNKISQPIKSKRSARSNAPPLTNRYSEISEDGRIVKGMRDLPARNRILPKVSSDEPVESPLGAGRMLAGAPSKARTRNQPEQPSKDAKLGTLRSSGFDDSCRVDTNEEDIADSAENTSRMVTRQGNPDAPDDEDDIENIKESIIVPEDTRRENYHRQLREPQLSEMNLKLKMNNPHSTKTNQRKIDLSGFFKKNENPYSPRGLINSSPYSGSPDRAKRFKETTPRHFTRAGVSPSAVRSRDKDSVMCSTARIEECGLSPKMGTMPHRFQPFQHTRKYFRKPNVVAFSVGPQFFAMPQEQINEATSRVQSRLVAASRELSVRTDLDRRRKTQQVQPQGLKHGAELLEIKRQSQDVTSMRQKLGPARVLAIKLATMEQVQKPANVISIAPDSSAFGKDGLENLESQPDLGSTERQHKELPRLTFGHEIDVGNGLIDSVVNEDHYSIALPHETRSPADATYGGLMKSRHQSTKAIKQPNLSTKHSKKLLAGTMDMRGQISPFKDGAVKEDQEMTTAQRIIRLKEVNRARRMKSNLLSKTVDDQFKKISLNTDPVQPYQQSVVPMGVKSRQSKHPLLQMQSKKKALSPNGKQLSSPREKQWGLQTAKASAEKSKAMRISVQKSNSEYLAPDQQMSVSSVLAGQERSRKLPASKAKLLFKKPSMHGAYTDTRSKAPLITDRPIGQESKINNLSQVSSQSGLAERRRSTLRSEASAPTAIKVPIKSKPAHPSASKKWRNGNSSLTMAYRTNDSASGLYGQKKLSGNGGSLRHWHGQTRPPQFAHVTMKKKSPGKAKNKLKSRPSRLQPKPAAENVMDSIRNSGDSGANVGAEGGSEPRPAEAEEPAGHVRCSQPIMIQNSVLHNAVITINIHQGQQERNMSEQDLARMIERNRKKVKAYLQNN